VRYTVPPEGGVTEPCLPAAGAACADAAGGSDAPAAINPGGAAGALAPSVPSASPGIVVATGKSSRAVPGESVGAASTTGTPINSARGFSGDGAGALLAADSA